MVYVCFMRSSSQALMMLLRSFMVSKVLMSTFLIQSPGQVSRVLARVSTAGMVSE